jgi:HEAT repeat protein
MTQTTSSALALLLFVVAAGPLNAQPNNDLNSPDPKVRKEAVERLALVKEDFERARSTLEIALTDRNEEVRVQAALGFRQLGPSAHEALPLLRQALSDPSKKVRDAALLALWAMGPYSRDAVPELIKALQDPQRYDRARVIDALGAIGYHAKPAVPELLPIFTDKSLPADIRRAAVNSIIKIGVGSPLVEDALFTIQGDEKEPIPLRCTCVRALGHVGVRKKENVELFIRYFREPVNGSLRLASIYAIEELGPEGKAAVRALTELLKTSLVAHPRTGQNVELYGHTMQALGAIGPEAKEAIPLLIEVLKLDCRGWHTNAQDTPGYEGTMQTIAARALGKMGPAAKDAIPVFLETLADRKASWHVKQAVCQALAAMPAESINPVRGLLRHRDSEARLHAIRTLGLMGPAARGALQDIRPALDDEDNLVRAEAQRAFDLIRR